MGAADGLLDHRKAQLDKQLASENAEAARLAAIRAENAKYEAQLTDIQRRMDAIQALENNREGPTRLMAVVAQVVNHAPGLFLRSVLPKENRVVFAGTSRSVIDIASLVAALERAPEFSDVVLREYYEDDDKDGRAAYKFTVDGIFQPHSPAGLQTAAGAATGGARQGGARGA